MSSDEFSMRHAGGLECQLVEWGGCPWVSCNGVSGVSPMSGGEFIVVVMHRILMSFIVQVVTCPMIRTASIVLLRNPLVNIDGRIRTRKVGYYSGAAFDFFFSLERKSFWLLQILVHICVEHSRIWISPNSDVNHCNLSYWLKEFGCMIRDAACVY